MTKESFPRVPTLCADQCKLSASFCPSPGGGAVEVLNLSAHHRLLKGPPKQQVFAGELVVGAIFCNTEIRVLILGARDFSCAVSGFGQAFISGLRPKSNPAAREKKPLVPRVTCTRKVKFHRFTSPYLDVSVAANLFPSSYAK